MAFDDLDPVTLAELRASNPTPGGVIQPGDLFEGARDGTPYGGQFSEIASFVLGNISVIENSNGTSIRVPVVRQQICYHTVPVGNLSAGQTASGVWEYPESFTGAPVTLATPTTNSSRSDIMGLRTVTTSYNSALIPNGINAEVHWSVRDDRPSGSSADTRLFLLAIGKY